MISYSQATHGVKQLVSFPVLRPLAATPALLTEVLVLTWLPLSRDPDAGLNPRTPES